MTRMPDQVSRHVAPRLEEATNAFRAVVVNGPRQSGKSTLLREMYRRTGGALHDLDAEPLLEAARADPLALVTGAEGHIYIDEVHRGGDALVRAIKQVVDDPRRSTRFVLAGSTNFLTVPSISESLAGRAVFVEVWPFSQGEIVGGSDAFLDRVVQDPEELRVHAPPAQTRRSHLERVAAGGFPEPLRLPSQRLRSTWFRSYVDTLTQRDIVELSRVRQAAELPRLLRYLAGETSHELIVTKLAHEIGLDRSTLTNYLPLLATVFLTRELPAWSRNPLGKVTQRPKVHLCDTGVAAALHGVTAEALERPISPLRGQLVESFVHNELVKQRTWCEEDVELYHWRDRDGAEVDLILETADGRVCGVEVKSSSSVSGGDFAWLRKLESRLGNQFRHGVVVYLGDRVLSFGPRMTAVPLSAIWA